MKKLIFALAVFLFVFVIGCSKGGNPVAGDPFSDITPVSDPAILAEMEQGFANSDGTVVMGAFQLNFNQETGELAMVSYDERELMHHLNVMRYLKPPYCPIAECWKAEYVYYDPLDEILEFDMLLYNPTPVTAYDVRVLFIQLWDTDVDPDTQELITENDMHVLNADGWTKINDNEDEDPEMNPYIMFNGEDIPTPAYPNPERVFEPYTLDTERLVLHWPSEAKVAPIFIIVASYPYPAEEVVEYMWVDQRPPMNPSINGFSYVSCALWEHHPDGEDEDLRVFFSCPDVLGYDTEEEPVEVELEKWYRDPVNEIDRYFLSWIVKIENLEGVDRVGDVPALLRAETPNQGDFDTYYKFDFRIRHNPGGEGHTDWDAPIAWTSFELGDGEIFVADDIFMNRTFSATESPDSLEIDPCWARKGSIWYLYFASDANWYEDGEDDFDIYVMLFNRVDGKMYPLNPGGIPYIMTMGWPADERAPAVSPDLSFMVFQGQDGIDGDWEIYRGEFDISGEPTSFTGIVYNLTDNGADDENPTIDAFGNYILFDSDLLGGTERNIFGMVPTPGSQVDLVIESAYDDTEPAFNPYNLNRLIFTRNTDGEKADLWGAEMSGYVVLDIFNITYQMPDSDEKHAAWAPSGNQIIFQSNNGDEGDYEIWTSDINGSVLDQVTYNEFDDLSPSWGPVP